MPFGRTPFGRTPFALSRSGGVSRPSNWADIIAWFRGTVYDGVYMRDFAQSLGDFPLLMSSGPCITLDGGTAKGTTAIDHGTIVSYEGTSTLVYDGTDLTGDAGTFYNLLFSDGTFFPCIGKTLTVNPTTIYATDGSTMVLTGTPTALHAGSQDTYFYEVEYGYWEDVSGRYPYTHSGATKHAGNQLNGAIVTYSFSAIGTPAPATIVTMDAVHQVFTDGSGNSVGFTQATLEALDNDQYFFGSVAPKPKELWCFNAVQIGVDLEESLVRAGKGEWKTDQYTGVYILGQYSGEKIYSEL